MTLHYRLDPRESRLTVQAFASGMLSLFAHSPVLAIPEFDGELQIDPETGAEAALRVAVQANSVQVTGNVKPQDREEIDRRTRLEVLETASYPTIAYEGTDSAATRLAPGWFRLRCRGKLSLHGVTGPLDLDAQLRINGDSMRLSGEFALLQSAYRIKRVAALGGTITVKDELKFSYDVAGHKI